jgi:predicted thioesterase
MRRPREAADVKAALKPGLKHRLSYTVLEGATVAHDGIDVMRSRHERFMVTWNKFNARFAEKALKAGVV